MENEHYSEKMKRHPIATGCCGIIFLFVMLIAVIVIFAPASPDSQTKIKDTPTVRPLELLQFDLQVNAMAATFAGYVIDPDGSADDTAPYDIINHGRAKYEVTSYFIDQTESGDTVRTDWSITLQYNGGVWFLDQNWTVHELIVDGQIIN